MRTDNRLFTYGPLALLGLGALSVGIRAVSAFAAGSALGVVELSALLFGLFLVAGTWAHLCSPHPESRLLPEPDWFFDDANDRHAWAHLREQFAHGQIELDELESGLGTLFGIPAPAVPLMVQTSTARPTVVSTQRGRLSPLAS